MREPEDVLRSMVRYVFSAMGGQPWRVRMAMDGRFQRPFALVSEVPTDGPVRQVDPGTVRQEMSINVQLYPQLPQPGPMRATEARLLTMRAADALTRALLVGVTDLRDATVRGHYNRIPLWDYHDEDGVPLPLEGEGSIATRRLKPDYLWLVDGWKVNTMPEASEDQLFVAIARLRVQWFRSSQLRPSGTTLEELRMNVRGDAPGQ